ncbi:hypothetical protein L195_g041607, partial [Trifolium pratense]
MMMKGLMTVKARVLIAASDPFTVRSR